MKEKEAGAIRCKCGEKKKENGKKRKEKKKREKIIKRKKQEQNMVEDGPSGKMDGRKWILS